MKVLSLGMGKLIIILFFCLTWHCSGQITFTSPVTQHWPSIFDSEFEQINRDITFNDSIITMVTRTKREIEIQNFTIKDIDYIDSTLVFSCHSRSKEEIRFILLPQENIENIDFYRRSKKTGEMVQVRFWIDSIRRYFK